jgi:hypothetical protein
MDDAAAVGFLPSISPTLLSYISIFSTKMFKMCALCIYNADGCKLFIVASIIIKELNSYHYLLFPVPITFI